MFPTCRWREAWSCRCWSHWPRSPRSPSCPGPSPPATPFSWTCDNNIQLTILFTFLYSQVCSQSCLPISPSNFWHCIFMCTYRDLTFKDPQCIKKNLPTICHFHFHTTVHSYRTGTTGTVYNLQTNIFNYSSFWLILRCAFKINFQICLNKNS